MTPRDWEANARDLAWSCAPVTGEALSFHRSLDGYAPSPLVELPEVAASLGVGRALAKDESSRFGLPAFKVLGASWAVRRALEARLRGDQSSITFVTASDGNHGRAVARTARLLGHRARVFVPDGVSAAAVEGIEAEGAPVVAVAGSYDRAVAAAAAFADAEGAVLLQDTAWPGYEQVPAWIVEGYSTLFAEADEQLATVGEAAPDLVVVPTGVGSLLQAAVMYYRSRPEPARTAVMSVEPAVAACVLASLRAGRAVSVPTQVTTMAGLNCGTVSSLAWPVLRAGLDAAVAVDDAEAAAAAPILRAAGVDAGPCGCAALAGAVAALTGRDADARRAALRIGPDATVLLIVTEGLAANPG
ncbi:MAG TPA: diaminopropionate ammonia-lyase [Candidatus Limnocylindrales bacterium]